MWELDYKESWVSKNWWFWIVVLEKTLESPLDCQGDQSSRSWRKSILNIHWKDWCCSWSSSTLVIWWKELIHLKRPWCWDRLKGGGEGDDRGWDGGMASLTPWTWVWVNSGSWWWTGRPGVLQSIGSQRVRYNWATELTKKIKNNSLIPSNIQICFSVSPVSQDSFYIYLVCFESGANQRSFISGC